jgi:hypothetical protein
MSMSMTDQFGRLLVNVRLSFSLLVNIRLALRLLNLKNRHWASQD